MANYIFELGTGERWGTINSLNAKILMEEFVHKNFGLKLLLFCLFFLFALTTLFHLTNSSFNALLFSVWLWKGWFTFLQMYCTNKFIETFENVVQFLSNVSFFTKCYRKMTDRKMTIHLNPTKVSFVLFFVELIFLNSVSHQLLYSAIYHARRNFLESNPKLFRCAKLLL